MRINEIVLYYYLPYAIFMPTHVKKFRIFITYFFKYLSSIIYFYILLYTLLEFS